MYTGIVNVERIPRLQHRLYEANGKCYYAESGLIAVLYCVN